MKGSISTLMAGALAILTVVGGSPVAAQDVKVAPAPRAIEWSDPGNKFGDATTTPTPTSAPPKVTSATGSPVVTPAPTPVSCVTNGYIANPADKTTYYECQFNPGTGKYVATLRSCPMGYTYNGSLIRCTN